MIAVWISGMNQTGGIQAFSRALTQALGENKNIYVVSKLDKSKNFSNDLRGRFVDQAKFYLLGNVPDFLRTIAFILVIVGTSILKRPKLIVVGLAQYAVIAKVVKFFLRTPYVVFCLWH